MLKWLKDIFHIEPPPPPEEDADDASEGGDDALEAESVASRDKQDVDREADAATVEPSAEPLSAATVRYDIHSHILPGVDDGSRTFDEACECIDLLIAHGYAGAVVTPHINRSMFGNDEPSLRDAWARFQPRIAERYEGFALHLAAEYMMDDAFLDTLYDAPSRLLRFGPPSEAFADGSYVLIEFHTAVLPANMDDLLSECRRQGLRPVLAHVERYAFVVSGRGHERLAAWRDGGAIAQLNIGSLSGQYGKAIQKAARALWDASLIDLLGTDMHRTERAATHLPESWRYVAEHPNQFNPALQQKLKE